MNLKKLIKVLEAETDKEKVAICIHRRGKGYKHTGLYAGAGRRSLSDGKRAIQL